MAAIRQNYVRTYLDYLPLAIHLHPVLEISDEEVFFTLDLTDIWLS
jgi:hypothetical protein